MNKVIHGHGVSKSVSWHANMPFIQKPKIRGSKIIDGIKFYVGYKKDQFFRADLFDKTFG